MLLKINKLYVFLGCLFLSIDAFASNSNEKSFKETQTDIWERRLNSILQEFCEKNEKSEERCRELVLQHQELEWKYKQLEERYQELDDRNFALTTNLQNLRFSMESYSKKHENLQTSLKDHIESTQKSIQNVLVPVLRLQESIQDVFVPVLRLQDRVAALETMDRGKDYNSIPSSRGQTPPPNQARGFQQSSSASSLNLFVSEGPIQEQDRLSSLELKTSDSFIQEVSTPNEIEIVSSEGMEELEKYLQRRKVIEEQQKKLPWKKTF